MFWGLGFGESTILGFDVLGRRALRLVVPCLVSPQPQGLVFWGKVFCIWWCLVW